MTKDTSSCSTSTVNTDSTDTLFENAHGPIPYNMTNDYMFRAVLQSNNKVLRVLICSLLHLDESQVQSVEVTNPIILGDALTDKEVRLDIYVLLNNQCIINLKMAAKNHHIYSCNFVLNVIDLSQIDLATEEDKKYQIDKWAKLEKSDVTQATQNKGNHRLLWFPLSTSLKILKSAHYNPALPRTLHAPNLHTYRSHTPAHRLFPAMPALLRYDLAVRQSQIQDR